MKAEGSTAEARVVCRLVGLDGKTRQFDVPVNGPILIGPRPLQPHHDRRRPGLAAARAGRARLEGFVVCDLNSVNGTYVNDVAVNRAILQPNDVIRCGPYSFRVEFRDAPEREDGDLHDSGPSDREVRRLRRLDDGVATRSNRPTTCRRPPGAARSSTWSSSRPSTATCARSTPSFSPSARPSTSASSCRSSPTRSGRSTRSPASSRFTSAAPRRAGPTSSAWRTRTSRTPRPSRRPCPKM